MRTQKSITQTQRTFLFLTLGTASLWPAIHSLGKGNPLESNISVTIQENGKTTAFEKVPPQTPVKPAPTPSLQSTITVTHPGLPSTEKPQAESPIPQIPKHNTQGEINQPPSKTLKTPPIIIEESTASPTPNPKPSAQFTPDKPPVILPSIIQAGTTSTTQETTVSQNPTPKLDSEKTSPTPNLTHKPSGKPPITQFLIEETDETPISGLPEKPTRPEEAKAPNTPTSATTNPPATPKEVGLSNISKIPEVISQKAIDTSIAPVTTETVFPPTEAIQTADSKSEKEKGTKELTPSIGIQQKTISKPTVQQAPKDTDKPTQQPSQEIGNLPAQPEITPSSSQKPIPKIEKLQITSAQKDLNPSIQENLLPTVAETPGRQNELNQTQIQNMIEQLSREASQKRAERSLPIPNPRKAFIEFINQPFSQVLRLLAEDAGFNYIEPSFGASKAGSAPISTRLLHITPLEAFIKIATSRGFTIINKDGYTTLSRPDIINPEFLIVKQYHLQHTNAKRAAQKIANLLNIKIKPPTDGLDSYPTPNKQATSFGGSSGGTGSGSNTGSGNTTTSNSGNGGSNSNVGLPTAPRWTSAIPFNEPAYTGDNAGGANGNPNQSEPPALWIDSSNNAILVRTTNENHKMILNHIVDLDVPEAQIEIDTKLIEITFSDGLKTGTDWTNIFSRGITPSIDLTGIPLNQLRSWGGASSVIIDTNQLNLTLQAFENLSNSNVLNMPKMLTQSGVPTHISSTSTRSIIGQSTATNTTSVNTPTTTFTTGTTIDVVPTILDNGRIEININPSVASSIDEGVRDPNGNTIPTVLQRSMTASAIIPNGMTMIIGGLVQAGSTNNEGGLPGLSKIPVVGKQIFGNSSKTKTKTTLLIFCTARIIQPQDYPQVYGDKKQWSTMKQSEVDSINTRLLPIPQRQTNTAPTPELKKQR